MQWSTVTQLGQHQHETREGYLAVEDVVIARTGTQIYYEHEIPPLIGDAGGRVHVEREAEDVFDPDSIRSFNGKPLCDDHPTTMVGPDNWSDLAIGYLDNVRRGEAPNDDVLLADMIFTTRKGIDAVRRGKRAVSVGYTANYEQSEPGIGRQKDIFCNHLALVDEGRCGSRCVILDGVPAYNHAAETDPEPVAIGWNDNVDYPEHEDIDYGATAVLTRPTFDRVARWLPKWFGLRVGDADFVESEHPRDANGKFTTGAGHASAIGDPLKWTGKTGLAVKSTALEGLAKGHEPHVIAANVKAIAATYAHGNVSSYANKVLAYTEKHYDLPKGALGKAYPKGQVPSLGEVKELPKTVPAVSKPVASDPGSGAMGTDLKTLGEIAGSPETLEKLSHSAHDLGIKLTGEITQASKEAKSAISTWTSPPGYKMLNNHLNGTATSEHAAEVAAKLQKSILSQKLPEAVNAYRGLHGPQWQQMNARKPGDVWTQKGFAATTLDPKRATHYAKGGQSGDLVHMVLPKGSKGLYVSHPDLNTHTSEREMLLPAGSTFKYLGNETMNLPLYDYSGHKVGEGGPVVVHKIQVLQPGDPEFEAAHPRGEGGKFVAGPGGDDEHEKLMPTDEPDAKPQPASDPPAPAAFLPTPYSMTNTVQTNLHAAVSKAQTNAEQMKLVNEVLGSGMSSQTTGYATALKAELEAHATIMGEPPVADPLAMVPIHAVHSVLTGEGHTQGKIDTLKELKKAAINQGHDFTEVDKGIQQALEDLGKELPMPDGTALQQEMWENAAASWATPIKAAQLEADIATAGAGPTKEYAKKLLAHIKGDPSPPEPTPATPEPKPSGPIPMPIPAAAGFIQSDLLKKIEAAPTLAEKIKIATETHWMSPNNVKFKEDVLKALHSLPPEGPEPHPGSKGQEQIHLQATNSAMTTEQKIAGIKIVMEHPNAGTMTKAFGQQWIEALGGPTATPGTPKPATPPTQPTATPAAPKNPLGLKKHPHFSHEGKQTFEDASGNKLVAVYHIDTERIPAGLYDKVSSAYGDDPTKGDTPAVGSAMQEAANHARGEMSSTEDAAADSYKGGGYQSINKAVLAGKTSQKISALRKIMKRTVIPATTPLFRGLKASLKELSGFDDPALAVGRAFVHKNFASCSRDITVAENFGASHYEGSPTTMMHVTIPAGAPGLVLGSQSSSEKETVLPDHSVFRIDRVEAFGSKTIKHHIYCTYVGTEGK